MTTNSNRNADNKPLTTTMEDYLEAIFDLDQNKKVVRVKDIAKRMGVKMPTVSSMLKILNDRGFVNYVKYEYVELTSQGIQIGKEMRRRHEVLLRFLVDILKIEFKTADKEACKMEHSLSSDTMESLTDFIEFIQACPRTGERWLNYFKEYRQNGYQPYKCQVRCEEFSSEFQNQVKKIENQKEK